MGGSTCVSVGHTWPDAVIAIVVATPTAISALAGLLAFLQHRTIRKMISGERPSEP